MKKIEYLNCLIFLILFLIATSNLFSQSVKKVSENQHANKYNITADPSQSVMSVNNITYMGWR